MDDNAEQSEQPRRNLSDVNACLTSFCVHVALMIFIGLLHSTVHRQPVGESMTVVLGKGPGDLGGDAGARPGGLEVNASLDVPTEATLENVFTNDQPLINEDLSKVLATSAQDVAIDPKMLRNLDRDLRGSSTSTDASLAAPDFGFGGRGTGTQGDGTGGGGDPLGQKGGFFGIPSRGRTIVYIIDSSGSMREKNKFKVASRELLQSLERLSRYQKFFVILYSDDAYPMDADEPVLATPEQVAEVTTWLGQIKPEGGTHPESAFTYAYNLEPDEIYFLSDGMFNGEKVLAQIQLADSGSQIPVHTIDFMSAQTMPLMKSIARRTGGSFRFVK